MNFQALLRQISYALIFLLLLMGCDPATLLPPPEQLAGLPTTSPEPTQAPTPAEVAADAALSQTSYFKNIKEYNSPQRVHLTQTIDGYTIAIQCVYADANHVIIAYTYDGPKGEPNHWQLTTANGVTLPRISVNGSNDYRAAIRAGSAYFSTASLDKIPDQLDLRFSLDYLYTQDTPSDPYSSGIVVAGPFIFDFTVTFREIGTRILEIHQSVKAADVEMVLERVVIAPTQVRATVIFDPSRRLVGFSAPITLTARSGENAISGELVENRDDNWVYIFRKPLLDKPGVWTLAVSEVLCRLSISMSAPNPLTGPWIFPFIVGSAQP